MMQLLTAFDKFRETLLGTQAYNKFKSGQSVKHAVVKKILESLNDTYRTDIDFDSFTAFLQLRTTKDDNQLLHLLKTEPHRFKPVIYQWTKQNPSRFNSLPLHIRTLLTDVIQDDVTNLSTSEAKDLASLFSNMSTISDLLAVIKEPMANGAVSMSAFCDSLHILKTSNPLIYDAYIERLTPVEKEGVLSLCFTHYFPSEASRQAFLFQINPEEGVQASYINACKELNHEYKQACNTLVADNVNEIPNLYTQRLGSNDDFASMSLEDITDQVSKTQLLHDQTVDCVQKRKKHIDLCLFPKADSGHLHIIDKYSQLRDKTHQRLQSLKQRQEQLQVEHARLTKEEESLKKKQKQVTTTNVKEAKLSQKQEAKRVFIDDCMKKYDASSAQLKSTLRQAEKYNIADAYLQFDDPTIYLPMLEWFKQAQINQILFFNTNPTNFRIMLRSRIEQDERTQRLALLDVSAIRFERGDTIQQSIGTFEGQQSIQKSLTYQVETTDTWLMSSGQSLLDVMVLNKLHVLSQAVLGGNSVNTIVVDLCRKQSDNDILMTFKRVKDMVAAHPSRPEAKVYGAILDQTDEDLELFQIFGALFMVAICMAQPTCTVLKIEYTIDMPEERVTFDPEINKVQLFMSTLAHTIFNPQDNASEFYHKQLLLHPPCLSLESFSTTIKSRLQEYVTAKMKATDAVTKTQYTNTIDAYKTAFNSIKLFDQKVVVPFIDVSKKQYTVRQYLMTPNCFKHDPNLSTKIRQACVTTLSRIANLDKGYENVRKNTMISMINRLADKMYD
jgi:hypothetical protein